MSKLAWIITRNRRLKCNFFALVLIAFVTTVALIKISISNVTLFSSNRTATMTTHKELILAKRTQKRKNFCHQISTHSKGKHWKTVRKWNYKLYNPPHFLNNFKNPCYLTNTTGQTDKPGGAHRSTGSLRLQCLPYFIIAGFPKSGTTDLWSRLMSHPDAKLRHIKEPQFFNIGRLKKWRFDRAVEDYATFYDGAATMLQNLVSPIDCQARPFPYHHGITGEATVDTVFDNREWTKYPGNKFCGEPVVTNADYVHQVNPNIKVILVVRNPTERLYSDYIYEARFIKYKTGIQLFHDAVIDTIKKHTECRKQHSIRACAYNDTLEDFKIRLRVGMYHIFISDWLDVFPKENILAINTEDTIGEKKSATYKRIFQFLNIRPFTRVEELLVFKRSNANVRRKEEASIGEMLPETRELIDKFYQPFNEKLAELYPDIDYNKKRVSDKTKGR